MRRSALFALIFLLATNPAAAKIGTIDLVPASTLLVPYFETDFDNPAGVDTLITVQNASASATMVHVTMWTDYGIPTDTFDIYLTGYDQETFSMREIMNRFLPITASDGQDFGDTSSPNDGISNQGPISQDINFASCTGQLPGGEDFISAQLPLAHMGLAASDYFGAGNCGGRNYGDGIARGYVTLDVTNQCACGATPATVGYFVNGGGGIAGNRNILLGEVTFLDRTGGRHFTEPAVHIETSATELNTPGEYTFYASHVNYTAADNREALPTAWVGKWAGNRTSAEVWRDPGVPVAAFACGGTPFTLNERQIRAYDQDGGVVPATTGNRFPRAAGVTRAGADLGLVTGWGSLFLNLNLPAPSGPLSSIRQSWVTWRQIPRDQPTNSPLGYSTHGVQLGNANAGDDPVIP